MTGPVTFLEYDDSLEIEENTYVIKWGGTAPLNSLAGKKWVQLDKWDENLVRTHNVLIGENETFTLVDKLHMDPQWDQSSLTLSNLPTPVLVGIGHHDPILIEDSSAEFEFNLPGTFVIRLNAKGWHTKEVEITVG